MQIPNFKELSQDKSLIEIQNYFHAISNEFYNFKESLFSQEACEERVRHLIDKYYKTGGIQAGLPDGIIYDSRTNRYQEEIYTFYCRDKKILDDFIEQLCKDADEEYEKFNFTNC